MKCGANEWEPLRIYTKCKLYLLSTLKIMSLKVINLPLRNSSSCSVHVLQLSQSVPLYQISVLSTFLCGGIGRKPSPGFVPIIDFSSFHFGMRGSSVWKKTHMQIATRAARTPQKIVQKIPILAARQKYYMWLEHLPK